jgi:hypothetical protein
MTSKCCSIHHLLFDCFAHTFCFAPFGRSLAPFGKADGSQSTLVRKEVIYMESNTCSNIGCNDETISVSGICDACAEFHAQQEAEDDAVEYLLSLREL